MKNLLKLIFSLLALTALALPATAREVADDADPFTLSKRQNLLIPSVPKGQHKAIAEYMKKEAQTLKQYGFNVQTERDGEVIVVTIPASELFEPNDTVLRATYNKKLQDLMNYLKVKDRFKVILAMYSDNTGSDIYKEQLTDARITALMEFVDTHANNPGQVIAYAMADDEPLAPNNTRANREKNRRLEFYIVPDKGLIKKIK